MGNMLNTASRLSMAAGGLVGLLAWAASLHAAPIQGFGELKFGMTPADVTALAGCSSQTECLYDLLGKNRYVVVGYGPAHGVSTPTPTPAGSAARLSRIDIDMGVYTQDWFQELFALFSSQYTLSHHPTEQEDAAFQDGRSPELVIGFADGLVLLKVVRRVFGNLIIRMVYQDADHARVRRQVWNAAPAS